MSENENAGPDRSGTDVRDSHAGRAERPENIVQVVLPQAARARLPNRRESESVAFFHEGHRYTATISRFVDGSIAEIFLDTGKFGADTAVNATDSAILASLCLQCGIPASTIRSVVRGPLARALGMFDGGAA